MSANKNLMYAIAGVGAVVGAAIIYSYVSGAEDEIEEEQEQDLSELLAEKGLNDVQRTS